MTCKTTQPRRAAPRSHTRCRPPQATQRSSSLCTAIPRLPPRASSDFRKAKASGPAHTHRRALCISRRPGKIRPQSKRHSRSGRLYCLYHSRFVPPLHGSCHILHLRMSYSVGRERAGKAEPVVPAAEGVLGVVRLQHRTDIGQPHAVAGFTLGGTGQLPLRDLHILSDPVAH